MLDLQRASYGVSFMNICEKIERVITAPHYTCHCTCHICLHAGSIPRLHQQKHTDWRTFFCNQNSFWIQHLSSTTMAVKIWQFQSVLAMELCVSSTKPPMCTIQWKLTLSGERILAGKIQSKDNEYIAKICVVKTLNKLPQIGWDRKIVTHVARMIQCK